MLLMDPSVRDHPKLTALAAHLHVSRPQAAGHLLFFWTRAYQYATHGHIDRFPESVVEGWAEWKSPSGAFLKALYACRLVDDGGVIHDFKDYWSPGESIPQYSSQPRLSKEGAKLKAAYPAFRLSTDGAIMSVIRQVIKASDFTVDEAIQRIEIWKASEEWKRGFVPRLAKFFREGTWLSDPTHVKKASEPEPWMKTFRVA